MSAEIALSGVVHAPTIFPINKSPASVNAVHLTHFNGDGAGLSLFGGIAIYLIFMGQTVWPAKSLTHVQRQ